MSRWVSRMVSRISRMHWAQWATLATLFLALGYLAWLGWGLLPRNHHEERAFNGERAMTWAQAQCDLGPRPAGSPEAFQTGDLIVRQLEAQGWKVRAQTFDHDSAQLRNLVGMKGEGSPVLALVTHYDTRMQADADSDPQKRDQPTLGANDGASGVSILLELARSLDFGRIEHPVWLVFLDGEANAGLPGWEAGLGAQALAQAVHPKAIIYLNLVGAANARFPRSPDATSLLQNQLWRLARTLEMDTVFLDDTGPLVQDAHTLFLEQKIPTAEILQPDYPYLHTTQDTCDQLDAATLQSVGRLLEAYVEGGRFLTLAPALR